MAVGRADVLFVVNSRVCPAAPSASHRRCQHFSTQACRDGWELHNQDKNVLLFVPDHYLRLKQTAARLAGHPVLSSRERRPQEVKTTGQESVCATCDIHQLVVFRKGWNVLERPKSFFGRAVFELSAFVVFSRALRQR